MKKTCRLLALTAALLLGSCDQNITSAQSEESSTVSLYKNGQIVSKKTILKSNDNQTLAMLAGSDTLCDIYVSCQDICGPDPEQIYFEVYAQKKGFYSVRKATSKNEVSFDLDKDFFPTEPNKTCGTISDKRYGSFYFRTALIYQNKQVVDTIKTDSLGRFATDLPFGNYSIKLFSEDGSPVRSDTTFTVKKKYDDYFVPIYDIIGD